VNTMNNSYADCLNEMYNLRRFGIKLGLQTIRQTLKNIGNPHKSFRSIHIAGTNGKGSVAATLESILNNAGFRTGLYTSPHLVKFNERIRIDCKDINDNRVVKLHQIVKKSHSGDRELTFFEYATAMAFYEFAEQSIDWAIVETGMGGRLDATNILLPHLSIITNISIEHREYLGNTLDAIAFEKAGIIKRKRPVISDVHQAKAFHVIQNVANQNNSPLYHLGHDIKIRKTGPQTFSYYGIHNRWKQLTLSLEGDHQFRNAALAIGACECLFPKKSILNQEIIETGLHHVRWPGRLEVIKTSPKIILDGAHNPSAIRRLINYLNQNTQKENLTLILGILSDKPYQMIMKNLLPFVNRLILTSPKIDRRIPADDLYSTASAYLSDIKIIADVGQAVQYAIKTSKPTDIICITGSLYVVGEAKAELSQTTSHLFLA